MPEIVLYQSNMAPTVQVVDGFTVEWYLGIVAFAVVFYAFTYTNLAMNAFAMFGVFFVAQPLLALLTYTGLYDYMDLLSPTTVVNAMPKFIYFMSCQMSLATSYML